VTAGFGDVGFLRLLDLGDVRRPTGADLRGRVDLPDFLSPDCRRLHQLRERQVSAQPRHPPSLLFKELDPDSPQDAQLKLDFGLERSHA